MNSVVHFEFPAKNMEEIRKFYAEVFGWNTIVMEEMNYTIVHTAEVDENTQLPKEPGTINGGIMTEEDNGGLNPVLVINVPSIDDHVSKIEEAGGKMIMAKTEVGDMGYYARFEDPSGVIMGIWENR